MKKSLIFVTVASVLSFNAAMATPINLGPTTNNNPTANASANQLQGQAQGQLQGQAQSLRNNIRNTNLNANVNANRNANRNTNNVSSRNRNSNVAYGGTATSSSRSRSTSYNAGNHQSMSYNESRDRLQAPGLAASFSSTVGSPCEATPFGLGATGPGFGGLFQIPVQRGECWGERSADRLMAWGCTNAALAVLAGNPVAIALQNNPCGGTRRAIRAKY